MNNKQQKIVGGTVLGTLGAEALIGGLGIGLLGTAVAVPASVVVATVGTIAFFAAGDEPTDNKLVVRPTAEASANTPDPNLKSFLLKKGTITHKISVNDVLGIAYACLKATSNASWTNYQHFNNIQEGRDFYKSLLQKGYVAA